MTLLEESPAILNISSFLCYSQLHYMPNYVIQESVMTGSPCNSKTKLLLTHNREADQDDFGVIVSTLVPLLTSPSTDLERREPPRPRYQCDRGTSGEPLRGALHREGVWLHRVLHRPCRYRWSVPLGQGRCGRQSHDRPRVEVARRESQVPAVGLLRILRMSNRIKSKFSHYRVQHMVAKML